MNKFYYLKDITQNDLNKLALERNKLNNIIIKIQKELELNLKFKVIGVKRLQNFINNLLEDKND